MGGGARPVIGCGGLGGGLSRLWGEVGGEGVDVSAITEASLCRWHTDRMLMNIIRDSLYEWM